MNELSGINVMQELTSSSIRFSLNFFRVFLFELFGRVNKYDM